MAHVGLDLRGHRRPAAGLGDRVQLGVGQHGAVHVGRVRAQQSPAGQLGDVPPGPAQPATDVHGDRHAELAGQRPVGGGRLDRRELRAAHGHPERDPGAVVRPDPGAQPPDVVGVRRPVPRQRLVVARAVGEQRASPGVDEGLPPGVGVFGAVDVVREVDDGRDAGGQRLHGAQQGAGVGVLGPEPAAEPAAHPREVLPQGPVGGDPPQRALPQVPVGVDQAGQHDPVPAVDHLGIHRRQQTTRRRRSGRPRRARPRGTAPSRRPSGAPSRRPAAFGSSCGH